MITINGIDHLNISVSNINESLNFYQKVFGFKVYEQGESHGEPYFIIGEKEALYLCLYQSKKRPGGPINHIGINVQNFNSIEERLRLADIPILYGGIVEYPLSHSIYIQDPDGNEIELSEIFGGGLKEALH
jgi:lactoylglutathione lyase